MSYKVVSQVGQALYDAGQYHGYMNDRMYELTGKGYSPEAAAKMTIAELGGAAGATAASQGLILRASAATGGVLGFELGAMVSGGSLAFPGALAGTLLAMIAGNALAFEGYRKLIGGGLELLIDPSMDPADIERFLEDKDWDELIPGGLPEPELNPGRAPWDDGNRQGPYPNDPLVFDLDGDNSLSVTSAQGGINFDHDNDGFAQLSAWVAQGDGILCIDRNGNGTIDNGLEIFGENMKLSNGSNATSALHALSEFDSDFRVLKLAA